MPRQPFMPRQTIDQAFFARHARLASAQAKERTDSMQRFRDDATHSMSIVAEDDTHLGVVIRERGKHAIAFAYFERKKPAGVVYTIARHDKLSELSIEPERLVMAGPDIQMPLRRCEMSEWRDAWEKAYSIRYGIVLQQIVDETAPEAPTVRRPRM